MTEMDKLKPFRAVLVGMVFGGILGSCLTAAIIDVEGAVARAEISLLYDTSIDGTMLYLECLSDDCSAEQIASEAVVAAAHDKLCQRGVTSSCLNRKARSHD
jgi:hypothetical protein